ncbi:winged helix-turn-helix domain-containing protein [Nocardia sp. NPDC052112]|uniref:winged helix-turn-helix domain-containing protein n=1 Tax=Nocardia sp. NPDC052112 TaxID=3155646 RepID=UPI003430F8C8
MENHSVALHRRGYSLSRSGAVVESYVSYLRRKIDTTEPKLIRTIRGVGYIMRRPRSDTVPPQS